MNQFVSLLTPASTNGPANVEPKFPEASARSRAATPFSSMLERAEYRAPERNPSNNKPARPAGTRSKSSADKSLSSETERRPAVREKRKEKQSEDNQSLAGACAVNGPAAKPEDCANQTATRGETETESAPVAATPAGPDASSVTASKTKSNSNTTAASASTSTANPTNNAAMAGVASAEPIETDAAPQAPKDIATLLQPAVPATAPESNTPETAKTDSAATTLAAPTPTAETQLASAAATLPSPVASVIENSAAASQPQANAMKKISDADGLSSDPTEVTDRTVPAPATSARQAEVILASATEAKTITNQPTANELSPDVATVTAAPEEVRQSARAARRIQAESLEKVDGIGGAKSSVTMKNAMKMEEVAGVAEQLLPGATAPAVSAIPNLPGEARRVLTGVNSSAEGLQAAGKIAAAPVRADVSTTADASEIRAASPLPRVSELISREVRMFKRAGDDLVEVVLTPDAKTQISLRLQWREGQVEVQARCDFGDYNSLNTQWQQLQTSMASHGVRLSHLSERTTTGFTEFFNNPNFAQQQGRDRQPETPLGRPDILPTVPAPTAKPGVSATPRRSNRLFDSWA